MLNPNLREALSHADLINIGSRIGITFNSPKDAKNFFEFLKNLLQNENTHIEIEHDQSIGEGSRVKKVLINGVEAENVSQYQSTEHDWMIVGDPENEEDTDYALFIREVHL